MNDCPEILLCETELRRILKEKRSGKNKALGNENLTYKVRIASLLHQPDTNRYTHTHTHTLITTLICCLQDYLFHVYSQLEQSYHKEMKTVSAEGQELLSVKILPCQTPRSQLNPHAIFVWIRGMLEGKKNVLIISRSLRCIYLTNYALKVCRRLIAQRLEWKVYVTLNNKA